MSKYSSLDGLFDDWKKECSAPFIPDGFLGDSEGPVEILFIAKESHHKEFDSLDDNKEPANETDKKDKEEPEFWLKKQVAKWCSEYVAEIELDKFEAVKGHSCGCTRFEKTIGTKFIKCMLRCYMLAKAVQKVNISVLENCAFINLNKHGGGRKCDDERLKKIALSEQKLIKKEIDIINPKTIILLGEVDSETKKIITDTGHEVKVFQYHPSARRSVSSGKFIE